MQSCDEICVSIPSTLEYVLQHCLQHLNFTKFHSFATLCLTRGSKLCTTLYGAFQKNVPEIEHPRCPRCKIFECYSSKTEKYTFLIPNYFRSLKIIRGTFSHSGRSCSDEAHPHIKLQLMSRPTIGGDEISEILQINLCTTSLRDP